MLVSLLPCIGVENGARFVLFLTYYPIRQYSQFMGRMNITVRIWWGKRVQVARHTGQGGVGLLWEVAWARRLWLEEARSGLKALGGQNAWRLAGEVGLVWETDQGQRRKTDTEAPVYSLPPLGSIASSCHSEFPTILPVQSRAIKGPWKKSEQGINKPRD